MKEIFMMLWALCVCDAFGVTARVTAHVVDGDSGEPIPNFNLDITYGKMRRGVGCGMEPLVFRRVTDGNGICRAVGDTDTGKIGFRSMEKGYYGEMVQFEFTNYVASLKRLVPDHQDVTVRVWKVGRQVPLVVRQFGSEDSVDLFAKGNNVLRLDCMLGDYLPPVGTGVVADVEFRRKVEEKMDGGLRLKYYGEMTTTFLGDGNGLVEVEPNPGSRLRVRSGIDADFEKEHVSWIKENLLSAKYVYLQYATTNSLDRSRCYCFRIRTMKDDSGAVTNAYYGKIYGDIYFAYAYDETREDNAQKMYIARPDLLYYINPTPMDKNLEFNRWNNLCPGQRGNYSFDN